MNFGDVGTILVLSAGAALGISLVNRPDVAAGVVVGGHKHSSAKACQARGGTWTKLNPPRCRAKFLGIFPSNCARNCCKCATVECKKAYNPLGRVPAC